MTERKGPLTTSAVRKIIARAGELAGLGCPVHPPLLRQACGFKLANDGHDTRASQQYRGNKNIQHTVRYTGLAPDRFDGLWKDELQKKAGRGGDQGVSRVPAAS